MLHVEMDEYTVPIAIDILLFWIGTIITKVVSNFRKLGKGQVQMYYHCCFARLVSRLLLDVIP